MSKRRYQKRRAARREQGIALHLRQVRMEIRSERLEKLADIATSGPTSLLICGAGMIVSRSGSVQRRAWG